MRYRSFCSLQEATECSRNLAAGYVSFCSSTSYCLSSATRANKINQLKCNESHMERNEHCGRAFQILDSDPVELLCPLLDDVTEFMCSTTLQLIFTLYFQL